MTSVLAYHQIMAPQPAYVYSPNIYTEPLDYGRFLEPNEHFLESVNNLLRKPKHLPCLQPVEQLRDANHGLISCLLNYDASYCRPAAGVFFGYVRARDGRDAANQLIQRVKSGGVDEWGQPIVETLSGRPLEKVLLDPSTRLLHGDFAWDPRYQLFLYVIQYRN